MTNRLKFISFLIAILLNCSVATGQNLISIGQLISSAERDPSLLSFQKEIDFLKNTDLDLPMAEKLEFRTESDEWEINRQEYLLRLSFNGSKARNSQKKLHQIQTEQLDIERLVRLKERMEDRYELALQIVVNQREINNLQKYLTILEDKIRVLNSLANMTTDFSINDLITAEDNYHEAEQQLLGLQGKRAWLQRYLQAFLGQSGTTLSLDTANLISVMKIEEVVNSIQQVTVNHPELLERQRRVDETLAEYELEDAETKKILDFVQMKYAGRDNLPFGREWSVGMGFNIPMKGSDAIDLHELTLQRIEDENRLQYLQWSLEEKLNKALLEIEQQIKQHKLILYQRSFSQARFTMNRYAELADAEPLVLLRINESLLRKEMNLTDLEKDIYFTYLEILSLSGKISEFPLTNYLSDELNKL